jgi:hypothetical protein
LGDIYLSAGMTDAATASWQRAPALNPRTRFRTATPAVRLFALKNDDRRAIEVFR